MEKDLKILADKIEGIRVAMLTTIDEDGTLISRPMATNRIEEDGSLWFFTYVNSPKIAEIKHQSEVNISYSEPKDEKYVSISGNAEIVKDSRKVKELWNPLLKAWFPKGEDDPNIMLLRVKLKKAQYWDTPSSTFVHLVGLAKSTFSDTPYEPGENKKINITHG